MSEHVRQYADVGLPVPLDQLFTYELPVSVRHRVQRGSRVLVPLGSRRMIGVVLEVHGKKPEQQARNILQLLDEQPVLEEELLRLGNWIAEYYCAPIGEVLRGMLPLSGEVRRSKSYALTDSGRDVARQLTVTHEEDPPTAILRLLEEKPRSAAYLAGKVPQAKQALKLLTKREWVVAEEQHAGRDPLRASAVRLEAEFLRRPEAGTKLKRSERELLAFLELHPGSHNLAQVAETVRNASSAARSLARLNLVRVEPERMRIGAGFERPVPTLNEHQQSAFDTIRSALEQRAYRCLLLQGVTGSGKTEVYMRSIEATLGFGRNALLLVPEIALTPAMAGQFFHRFGDQVAILHSAFSDTERADQWRRIRQGEARVIVGTRSGIFAPVQNLGLLIVDEEHDGSYKQEETPRYHGRDVAIVRARQAGAVAVLGSATPSMETRYNAETGKNTRLVLPMRIGDRPMPQVEIIDMREEFLETRKQSTFSRKLLDEISARLAQSEQTMLLLNRRGFSSFMVCRSCGERLQCANCAVCLTYHRRDRRMLCHYCGYAERVPDRCPKCDSEHVQFLGTGSERVEDELHQHFPAARIARLDRDSAKSKGAFEHILQRFRAGEIDILVGTQMIAKGHDIANVTLVGVVLADIGLSMPDFRAAERSFQLLTQAAGRAGRGDDPGRVIVQTLNPDHYAIKLAAAQDYEAFYCKEVEFRRWLRYPPFAAFANVVLRAEKQEEALRYSTEFGRLMMPPPEGVRVLGPAEAPVPRLKSEYRYQLLIKASKRSVLRSLITRLRDYSLKQGWPSTGVVIDVDPLTLT